MNIERWGWYSMAVNVILASINMAIATASGSLAVGAETVHNLVDLLTAAALLIGLKLSTRKPKAFLHGLYKLEKVVAVVLAVIIFLLPPDRVAALVIKEDKERRREAQECEGIRICVEIIQQVREIPGVADVHIMAIEWEEAVAEIARQASLQPRPRVD